LECKEPPNLSKNIKGKDKAKFPTAVFYNNNESVVSVKKLEGNKRVVQVTSIKNDAMHQQTTSVGKPTYLPRKNITVPMAKNESPSIIRQTNSSRQKLSMIQPKNLEATNDVGTKDCNITINEKKKKREREHDVVADSIEKYDIPRKKKEKKDIAVSSGVLKNPPNNEDVVKHNNNNNNNVSTSNTDSNMIKTKRNLIDNNSI
jgi:hypothetical protein